jgi:hypothetical protein
MSTIDEIDIDDDPAFALDGMALADPPEAPASVVDPQALASVGRSGLPLYFDLETAPDYSRLEQFGLDPLPEPRPITVDGLPAIEELLKNAIPQIEAALRQINPPPEWLDQAESFERAGKSRAGVLAAINTCRNGDATIAKAGEDRRKLLSVTPEYCRIVALGWAIGGDAEVALLATNEDEERVLLERFWKLAKQHSPLVGFNILLFDLPVILVRSALLGVPATTRFDLKPWGPAVVDLMRARFAAGKAMKLKSLCKCYGIDVPAGDTDGGDVEAMLQNDRGLLLEYVMSDVAIARELHRFYAGYFCV